MKLKYCSITGADDAVDPQELAALSKAFPFAEWAILLAPESAGTPRFPLVSWIEYFKSVCTKSHKAMHLCGEALIRFSQGDTEILEIMNGIDRIQLNLKFGAVEGRYNPDELLARVRENPKWQFIIQYAPDKKHLLPVLQPIQNHAILFDISAGRGLSPDAWDAPIDGHFCGYAGGLKPENIAAELLRIEKAAPHYTTWIDMETGVRTNDRFDLKKVKTVLETAQPYA